MHIAHLSIIIWHLLEYFDWVYLLFFNDKCEMRNAKCEVIIKSLSTTEF